MNQSHRLKNKTRHKYQKITKFTKSLSFPKFTRKRKIKNKTHVPLLQESVSPPLQYVLVPPPQNTHIDFDARRIDPIKNAGRSEIILLFIMHGQDLKTNLDEKLKENTLMFSMAQPGCASSLTCLYNVESKSNVTGVSPYFIKKYLTQKLRYGYRSVVDVMRELSENYRNGVCIKQYDIPSVSFNYLSEHSKEMFKYNRGNRDKTFLNNDLKLLKEHKYATPMVYTKDRKYTSFYESYEEKEMRESENINAEYKFSKTPYDKTSIKRLKSLSIPLGIHVIDVRYPKTIQQSDLFKNFDKSIFKSSNMIARNIVEFKLSDLLKSLKNKMGFDNVAIFDYACRANGNPETYGHDVKAGEEISRIFKSKGLG
jgi:hypothetical protein